MTLSIDVLPAPLCPIMARVSPLRISNETPGTALTPPKANETSSTESSTSPAAICCLVGGLTRALPPRRLCGRGHSRGCRQRGHIADFHARGQHALAAVLESHFGRDVGLARPAIERSQERRITLRNKPAAHLLRPRDFAVIGIELLVQDQETADLGARPLWR